MENEVTNMMPAEPKSKNIGAIIGAIIIIVILIAGGWYFIGNKVDKMQEQKEATTNEIVTGDSTEVTDIEKDLQNVNLDVLNQ